MKFTVHIKEIKVSLDHVNDKVGRLILTFWPTESPDLVPELNSLQKPDTNIICILEIENKLIPMKEE